MFQPREIVKLIFLMKFLDTEKIMRHVKEKHIRYLPAYCSDRKTKPQGKSIPFLLQIY